MLRIQPKALICKLCPTVEHLTLQFSDRQESLLLSFIWSFFNPVTYVRASKGVSFLRPLKRSATHQLANYRITSQIGVWCLQQTPVSALVVGNECLDLVIYLFVSQEYAFDPCYLGKTERDEKKYIGRSGQWKGPSEHPEQQKLSAKAIKLYQSSLTRLWMTLQVHLVTSYTVERALSIPLSLRKRQAYS